MRTSIEGRETEPSLKRPLLSFSSFMLAAIVGVISSFTFSTVYDMARTALLDEPQAISGVWRGTWHGVPAVLIRLKQDGSVLSGTAQFSKIAASIDGPEVIAETYELPLVNPRLDGKKLCFQVEDETNPYPVRVVEMEMNFLSADEAKLRRTGGQPDETPIDKDIVIKMKKESSF